VPAAIVAPTVTIPVEPVPLATAPAPEDVYAPEPLPEQPDMTVGATVEISGEYVCAGCGMVRTWLKGDILEPCDNVECLNNSKGWKLSCDLF
jgi:hypothetical protein